MTSERREKAIKYLTKEIRSLRMEPQINGCGPENWAEQMEVMESCMEAVMAYHIGEATDMIPLTLEQLRGMDGQPVWCKSLINGKSEWAIIRIVEMSKTWFIALAGASQGFGDKDTYGKTWLAHAYPPAHIDREAWTAEWVKRGSRYICSSCGVRCAEESDETYYYQLLSKFCPNCGKAMTPEAWAELEKRVRV